MLKFSINTRLRHLLRSLKYKEPFSDFCVAHDQLQPNCSLNLFIFLTLLINSFCRPLSTTNAGMGFLSTMHMAPAAYLASTKYANGISYQEPFIS